MVRASWGEGGKKIIISILGVFCVHRTYTVYKCIYKWVLLYCILIYCKWGFRMDFYFVTTGCGFLRSANNVTIHQSITSVSIRRTLILSFLRHPPACSGWSSFSYKTQSFYINFFTKLETKSRPTTGVCLCRHAQPIARGGYKTESNNNMQSDATFGLIQ